MAARIPRLVIIAVFGMLALAGLALAAGGSLVSSSSPPASTIPVTQQRAVLVVPDVKNQAFVIAKISIQDAGMAWKVVGKVRGYPANTVFSQTPAAGTRVYDTGAPLVTLQLAVNKKYPQTGTPQDVSPFPATDVEPVDSPSLSPAGSQKATPTTTAAAPPATTATTTATVPATTNAVSPAASPVAAPKQAKKYPQVRPPAFAVAGAPAEPLDEMPLVDRAKALDRWLSQHPKPTNATVNHWLYQNAWIVTGARFGWWHGAQALRVLLRVDRRTETLWGVGAKSEAVAAGALTEVEARSK